MANKCNSNPDTILEYRNSVKRDSKDRPKESYAEWMRKNYNTGRTKNR